MKYDAANNWIDRLQTYRGVGGVDSLKIFTACTLEEDVIPFATKEDFTFGLLEAEDGSIYKHFTLSLTGTDYYTHDVMFASEQVFYQDEYFYGHVEDRNADELWIFRAHVMTSDTVPSLQLIRPFLDPHLEQNFYISMQQEHFFMAVEMNYDA